MTKKTVVILGAGEEQLPLYHLCKKMSLNIIGVDKNKDSPGLKFSDYKLICKNSDALIFLVSLRFAKKSFIRKAYEEIKSSKFNILGIITNSLNNGDSFEEEDQVFKYYEENKKTSNKLDQIFSIKINTRLGKLIKKASKFFRWLDK